MSRISREKKTRRFSTRLENARAYFEGTLRGFEFLAQENIAAEKQASEEYVQTTKRYDVYRRSNAGQLAGCSLLSCLACARHTCDRDLHCAEKAENVRHFTSLRNSATHKERQAKNRIDILNAHTEKKWSLVRKRRIEAERRADKEVLKLIHRFESETRAWWPGLTSRATKEHRR